MNQPRTAFRPLDSVGIACAIAWFVGLGLGVPCDADAQMLSLAETENLVRAAHYEGMPEDETSRIGPEGCTRLVDMLADPNEARHHGQILVAIGICQPAGGLEAILAWADQPREGEVDRATYRAWQALPIALAHLAENDRRALRRLERRLEMSAAPNWRFRQHRGARLVGQARRAAATGLALTGLPEAEQALSRAARASSDESLRHHVEEVREGHRERALRRAERAATRGGKGRR